jgi:hypothetical protein
MKTGLQIPSKTPMVFKTLKYKSETTNPSIMNTPIFPSFFSVIHAKKL